MSKYYDGALVMPKGHAVMSEEEMTYVEGGKDWDRLPMQKEFLNRSFCLKKGHELVDKYKWKNVTGDQLAMEIRGHAIVYYQPALALAALAMKDGDGKSLFSHVANGVDVENKVDRYQLAWALLWLY